jgi:hypothetical protein
MKFPVLTIAHHSFLPSVYRAAEAVAVTIGSGFQSQFWQILVCALTL